MQAELVKEYNRKRHHIKQRLREFRSLYKAKDEDIFSELCFCILTAQSKAVNCDKAIRRLRKRGLLFKGNKSQIRAKLKGVRFPNNKASYIVATRKFLQSSNKLKIKNKIDADDVFKTRDWLVKNIKGLGYKEASHFLRNIGLGQNIAILDRHILQDLKKYRVIEGIPKSMSKKRYIEIEDKFRNFSYKVNIPMQELDLLFWSHETGFIFK